MPPIKSVSLVFVVPSSVRLDPELLVVTTVKTMSLNLFDFKVDGSLIPYGLDQDIRAANHSNPETRAALDKLEVRFHRLEDNKQEIELEVSAAVAITVTVLQQLKGNHHEEQLKKEFRTQVLGGLLQFSNNQVSRIVKAAEVQLYSQHLPTAERKLLETTSSHGLYEFSKLNKYERKACLEEHLHLGKELSKRSVLKHKRPVLGGISPKPDPLAPGISGATLQEQSPVEAPVTTPPTETSMADTTDTTVIETQASEASANGEDKEYLGGISFTTCLAVIRAKAEGLTSAHRRKIVRELELLSREINNM